MNSLVRPAAENRQRICWCRRVTLIAVVLCFTVIIQSRGQAAQTVWTDPATGIAIGGYDPLSYFIGGRPGLGSMRHEYEWRGVSWRFSNAANRHAFRRNPKVYAPRFGGHGAMAMAQGHANAGNPTIWLIHKSRLYLFYSLAARRKWLLAPKSTISRATSNWPKLRPQLQY